MRGGRVRSQAADVTTTWAVEGAFVGRRDERARFAALLKTMPTGRRARWRRRSEGRSGPVSRVVLVHGLGGSGKSRLLHYFQEMAEGEVGDSPVSPGRIRTVWLDWEDEMRDQPSRYADIQGPSLVTVLDAVRAAVIDAIGEDVRGADQAFEGYVRGAARMPEYAARFSEVLAQSRQSGSPFTAEDAGTLVKSAVSAGLTFSGHPGGLLGLTPDQLKDSAKAAGHLSTAAARAVTGRKTGVLSPDEYDLVTDPVRELTRRLAAAVRTVAGRQPMVVLLDTGEVVGLRAWNWLRHVMAQTGPRVLWVVGARFETEAEAGVDSPVVQFVRDIGDARLLLMSPTRFDDSMIRDYLGTRMPGRRYTDAQIDVIARFTKGLPLAVSLAAKLLDEDQPVEDVCRQMDAGHPSSIVSQLARRYLIHAEQLVHSDDDPRRGDVEKILGLALTIGDLRSDPELLRTLWNVPDPLEAFLDLARRHDFVLPGSRRLHDDVRDTLRTDLLDPFRRDRVRVINQRALDLFAERLMQLRIKWPLVDDQLNNSHYDTTLLAYLWHSLWRDNQVGLEIFINILPVLAVTAPETADAAASVVDTFASTFDDKQHRELDLVTTDSPRTTAERLREIQQRTFVRAERRVKSVLPHAALQRASRNEVECMLGDATDRGIALMILQARLQATNHNDKEAVAILRSAADRTYSTSMRKQIGNEAHAIANRLIWAGVDDTAVPTAIGLAAAHVATETYTNDDGAAWHNYAVALGEAGRLEESLTTYDRAIDLNPDNGAYHSNRSIALERLGRLEESLTARDRAIALNPDYGDFHNNRGITLLRLGRLEESLTAFDQAIALNPDDGDYHSNRGITLQRLGRLEESLTAHDQAIALNPDNGDYHNNRGITLQRLGRLEESLTAFDQAIALNPDDGDYHSNRGIALATIGELSEALAEFDVAEQLSPGHTGEARIWAGAILWHRQDIAGARDRFARAENRVTGCSPFRTVELETIALCGVEQANDYERRLRDSLSLRTPGDRLESQVMYDLLSDPPLPGIDQIRSIVASDM
ncbi:tetratricopeptide repeat protein [Amycolatopsis sp. NPDC003865]